MFKEILLKVRTTMVALYFPRTSTSLLRKIPLIALLAGLLSACESQVDKCVSIHMKAKLVENEQKLKHNQMALLHNTKQKACLKENAEYYAEKRKRDLEKAYHPITDEDFWKPRIVGGERGPCDEPMGTQEVDDRPLEVIEAEMMRFCMRLER